MIRRRHRIVGSGRGALTVFSVSAAVLVGVGIVIPTWRSVHQIDLIHSLIRAVEDNNPKAVSSLLGDGADPNAIVIDDARPFWKKLLDALMRRPLPTSRVTVMWRAAYWFHRLPDGSTVDNWETIKQLADAGADVNLHLPDGSSPLIAITAFCKVKSLKLLLDHGANVGVLDEFGDTPLHYAASALREDMAALLLQHGADLEAKNQKGVTPLVAALESYPGEGEIDKGRSRHMARFLFARGATLEGVTQDGQTLPELAKLCRDKFHDPRLAKLIKEERPTAK
jgi:ankyrin repeat protein